MSGTVYAAYLFRNTSRLPARVRGMRRASTGLSSARMELRVPVSDPTLSHGLTEGERLTLGREVTTLTGQQESQKRVGCLVHVCLGFPPPACDLICSTLPP